MSRPPYVLARSAALADETYFHRRNLTERLLALASGRKLVLVEARLGRARLPHGHALRAYARSAGEDEPLGYVLRQGFDAADLRERLYAELDAQAPQMLARRAA